MKKYLRLFSILFVFLLILPICQVHAAIAAEPHTYEDLVNFGKLDAFNPTVRLGNGCSASRITIFEDDPIGFFITAAHCFESEENASDYVEAIANYAQLLGSIDMLEGEEEGVLDLLRNTTEFQAVLEEMGEEEILRKLKIFLNEFILLTRMIGVMPTSSKELDRAINSVHKDVLGVYDTYEYSRVKYVIHQDSDQALFTACEDTGKVAYPVYRENPEKLENEKLISVGFGVNPLDDSLLLSPDVRQAFDAQMSTYSEYYNEHRGMRKALESEVYQASLNLTKNDYPMGIVTAGDSGGSLLIQSRDEEDKLLLVGVVSGHGK